MTRMTGPDCVVMCNLINTHTHTHTHPCAVMCNLINTHTHTHSHSHTDTNTRTRTRTRTHTHTHTHIMPEYNSHPRQGSPNRPLNYTSNYFRSSTCKSFTVGRHEYLYQWSVARRWPTFPVQQTTSGIGPGLQHSRYLGLATNTLNVTSNNNNR